MDVKLSWQVRSVRKCIQRNRKCADSRTGMTQYYVLILSPRSRSQQSNHNLQPSHQRNHADNHWQNRKLPSVWDTKVRAPFGARYKRGKMKCPQREACGNLHPNLGSPIDAPRWKPRRSVVTAAGWRIAECSVYWIHCTTILLHTSTENASHVGQHT